MLAGGGGVCPAFPRVKFEIKLGDNWGGGGGGGGAGPQEPPPPVPAGMRKVNPWSGLAGSLFFIELKNCVIAGQKC
jgi:hypothetical protein